MTEQRRIYAPPVPCAIAPRAYGIGYEPSPPSGVETTGGVAVVHIRGPLLDRMNWCFDSYEAIEARVTEALAGKPAAVMLVIDSPGGVVTGCFEASAKLRSTAAAAGVRLHAHVVGQATSAAYALACSAERITATRTSVIGSIGVIDALVDATKADALWGLAYTVITSGDRKGDGNPHSPTTDGAISARQDIVDGLAAEFFALVEGARELPAAKVKGFEAGIFLGAQAQAVGLIDALGTIDEALASASEGDNVADENEDKDKDKGATSYKDAVAALRKAAEKDDDDGKAAKKMLAALDEDEEGDDDDTASSSEGEDKDKDAKAIALETKALVLAERRERRVAEMLSTRPDLTAEQRAAFAKLTPEQLEPVLRALPRAAAANPAAANSPEVRPTLGKGQGGPTAPKPSDDPVLSAMDRSFGLDAKHPGVKRDESGSLTFSMISHQEAEDLIKKGGSL